MKKSILLASMAIMPASLMAQSPVDAYQISQPDLKGTARFMSMGGAFGALGGDLSTLSQNPAGIGVYRSNEVGFTLDFDFQSSKTNYMGFENSDSQTKTYLNNIGFVWSLRLGNRVLRNLNFGFTYNKGASFNRRYSGGIPQLKTSLSNYLAGIANSYELNEADVQTTNNYDPYNPGGNRYVPWSAILGYDSYLINPEGDPDYPNWQGQFGNGTSGSGSYYVKESGGVDEYNIAVGGNFADKLYWGMNFDITSVNYNIRSVWSENLNGAYVYDPDVKRVEQMDANWSVDNLYNMNGNGFKYSLGVILKPIQELRIGLGFHTPTFYHITENYYPDEVDYDYPFMDKPDYAVTNNGESTYNKVNLNTPWKVMASVAGVIGSKAIISFDYEWTGTKHMRYHNADYYSWNDWDNDYDWGWDWYGNPGTRAADEYSPIADANHMIDVMYKNTNTIRLGAEYRVLPMLSLRAGYSWTSSPVTSKAKDNLANVPTAGTLANFRLDNQTNYVTCGLGFHFSGFYIDAAYVWKHMTSSYSPFAADPSNVAGTAMNPKITFNNSQLVLSAGYRF